MDPPFETARAQSELFAVHCCQWEPIQNGQLIRKFKKIPVHLQTYRYQNQMALPPFETASEQSELFAVLCGQWDPIWNSQLIRKYKEIPGAMADL